jgi:predicted Zn-dependent peptidase
MAYHRSQYGEMDIICSGLITDSIRKSIGEAFGKLNIQKATDQVHTLTGKVPFSQYVEREHAVQTSIRLGKFVIGRSHTDYPALLLLNHIFGGYFGSRLMKNIREDKGLTYGIYSSVTSPRHASYLTIGADVNKENRVITVEEIKKEMHRLRTERIGVNELETARNHFIGSLQSEITTPFAHADKIKSIQLNELPADYYASLIQKIETLTSDDLIRVANAEFDESSFFEVSVG